MTLLRSYAERGHFCFITYSIRICEKLQRSGITKNGHRPFTKHLLLFSSKGASAFKIVLQFDWFH